MNRAQIPTAIQEVARLRVRRTRPVRGVFVAMLLVIVGGYVPSTALATSADSTVIWGPGKWVKGSPTGSWSYETDMFVADSIRGQRYILEIWNTGCTGVTAVVDSQQWVGSSEIASGSHALRTMDIGQTGNHSITIGLNGTAVSSYIWARIVRVTDPTFVVCPNVYFVRPASITTQFAYFDAPSGPTQYTMRVVNGLPNGTNRTTSGTLWLNDTVEPVTYSTGVATSTFNVSVSPDGPTNAISFKNTGAANTRIKVRVSAIDNSAPVLTLTQPATDTVYTKSSVAYFTGSVSDETQGWLIISETTPWLTQTSRPWIPTPGPLSDSVSTVAQGRHRIRLQVTNGPKLTTTIERWVVRDTVGPTFDVTSPGSGPVTTTDSMVTIAGSWGDSTWSLVTVDGDTAAAGYAGSFTNPLGSYHLDMGMNRIVLRAIDKLGNTTEYTRMVFRATAGETASHPDTSASVLATTALTSFYDGVRFLFTNQNPVQVMAVNDTANFDRDRVVVVRGRVIARDSGPLPNVTVRILNHLEYGYTLTRADGRFDLVVNGGTQLTLRFSKANYLEGQRAVQLPVNDYVVVDDVALVGRSAKVNVVRLSAQTLVRGRFATDANGDREIRLLFQAGTVAKIARSAGDSVSLDSLRLRLTEYTVGANGAQSMPALLSPSSAYTYCLDFSVDEADSIGQVTHPELPVPDVLFTKPVICFLRNFLQYPVGTAVPYGYYDRRTGKWVAMNDGWVVKILTDSAGTVTIDSDGDGQADGYARLGSLGISTAELQVLSAQYNKGDIIWRVSVSRFSNCDFNVNVNNVFPLGVGNVARPERLLETPCEITGSIINCEDRTLGERLPILGTPFSLNYRSFRASGDSVMRTVRIPVVRDSIPSGLQRIIVELLVAGKQYRRIVSNPTLFTSPVTITWDGLDVYNRPVGAARAVVGVGYEFRVSVSGGTGGLSLGDPAAKGSSLGEAGGDRQVSFVAWNRQTISLGVPGTGSDGLGGWTLSPHHFYDNTGDGTVYLGDGSIIRGDLLPMTARQYIGDRLVIGQCSNADTVYNLTSFRLMSGLLAYGPAGDLYISPGCKTVYRVDATGRASRIAGTGNTGSYQDNVLATTTPLPHDITGLAVGPDGSVYVASSHYFSPDETLVLVVTPDGYIHKIIGGVSGQTYGGGDGLPTSQAWVGYVSSLAVGPDGSLFLIDGGPANSAGRYHVRRIGTNNIITNYAGNGVDNNSDSVGVATTIGMNGVLNTMTMAIDGAGALYVACGSRIRRVSTDGIVSTLVNVQSYNSRLNWAQAVAVAADGTVFVVGVDNSYVNSIGSRCLRREPDGSISSIGFTSVFDEGASYPTPTGVPFTRVTSQQVWSMVIGPKGALLLSHYSTVTRVDRPFEVLSGDQVSIPSRDGRERYVFGTSGATAGRHLYTRDAFTGAVRHQFVYDAAGRLVTVRDVNGLTTTIQRDPASGQPIAIVAPFGQRTRLSAPGGYLATVEDTLGHGVDLTTRSDGLLETLTDQVGHQKKFYYGTDGRLWRDEDPAGSGEWQELDVAYDGPNRTTTRTTPETRVATYAVTELQDGTIQRKQELVATGLRSVRSDSSTARGYGLWPNGSLSVDSVEADPRFGYAAPLVRESRSYLASGLARVINRRRLMPVGFDPPFVKGVWAEYDSINGAAAYRVQFNADNLSMSMRSPMGRTVAVTVDSVGRPVTVAVPGLAPLTFAYNGQQLRQISDGNRGGIGLDYDSHGRLAVVRDTLHRTTVLGYDSVDRLTSATLPAGSQAAFTHDNAGRLTSISPPSKPAHSFEYTATNLLDTYRPPSAGMPNSLTQFKYNRDHQLTKILRPDGNNISLGYGLDGRLDSLTTARGKWSATYLGSGLGAGLLSTLTSPDGVTLTYGYNAPADTIETWSGAIGGSVSVALNRDFLVSSQRVNGGNMVAYDYDADGLLTKVGDLTVDRRSDNGLDSSTTLLSITTRESYSNHGEPWKRTASYQGTFYDATYGRDSLGRITSIVEAISGTAPMTYVFAYSDSGFLTSVSKDGVITERYSYDGNGNRLRYNPPGTLVTADYDDQDRLTRYGPTYYAYTAAGDLAKSGPGEISGGSIEIADTSATRYTYDALGNLLKVRFPNGDSLDYLVDGRNRRVMRKLNGAVTHRWLYQDDLEPVAELNGSGSVVSRFVYGTRSHVPDYFSKDGVTYRIVSDHLGSVRLVVNASTGVIVQRIDYDAFGRVINDSNPGFQPFGYAGGLWDAKSGLVRFGARDCDPLTGRWTTKDAASFVGGSNLYVYCKSEPVNASDPSGLSVTYGVGFTGGAFVFINLSAGVVLSNGVIGVVGQAGVMWGVGITVNAGPAFGGGINDAPTSSDWQGKNRFAMLEGHPTFHMEGGGACLGGVVGTVDTPARDQERGVSGGVGKLRPVGGLGGYGAAGFSGNVGFYLNWGELLSEWTGNVGGAIKTDMYMRGRRR